MIPILEHIIRSMIPEWDTNSLLCFLLKNFVYQSLTDLSAILFSEYLSVSHIDHRDVPHSTFFHFNGQSIFQVQFHNHLYKCVQLLICPCHIQK